MEIYYEKMDALIDEEFEACKKVREFAEQLKKQKQTYEYNVKYVPLKIASHREAQETSFAL